MLLQQSNDIFLTEPGRVLTAGTLIKWDIFRCEADNVQYLAQWVENIKQGTNHENKEDIIEAHVSHPPAQPCHGLATALLRAKMKPVRWARGPLWASKGSQIASSKQQFT